MTKPAFQKFELSFRPDEIDAKDISYITLYISSTSAGTDRESIIKMLVELFDGFGFDSKKYGGSDVAYIGGIKEDVDSDQNEAGLFTEQVLNRKMPRLKFRTEEDLLFFQNIVTFNSGESPVFSRSQRPTILEFNDFTKVSDRLDISVDIRSLQKYLAYKEIKNVIDFKKFRSGIDQEDSLQNR